MYEKTKQKKDKRTINYLPHCKSKVKICHCLPLPRIPSKIDTERLCGAQSLPMKQKIHGTGRRSMDQLRHW